jgi:acyl-CoA synthetase (AMP-forming)/AMP-acid ligase II
MEAPDLLTQGATRFPQRACVVESDRARTFAEADEHAARGAAAMRAAGVRSGDRVALLARNELEYLEIMAASQRAEAILVPLNNRLTTPELAYIVADCSPRLLIQGPGYADVAAALDVEHTWHLGDEGTGRPYDGVLAATEPMPRGVLDSAAAGTILYTSGTTGRPKGAVLSNGALATRMLFIVVESGARSGDVFVQTLPMFHIAANISAAYAVIGGTNVMVTAFDPAEVVALLARHRATAILLVPTTINRLCDEPSLLTADLSALRLVHYGASPIPPEVLRRALRLLRCGFLQYFGMTETSGCTLLRPDDHDPECHPERLASAGTETLTFSVRVVDGEDRAVGPGEVGEVVCRGPAVMDGYWNNPEATAEALRGRWMHTGDLGYRDANGYLFITDRLKDMIVTGGENVYPREVEDVIYEHPGVLEAAVIGIPDERWGEAVHAIVVPRGAGPSGDELLDHCRARLAGYKVPKSVEFVDALPRNVTGKVLKRELREHRAALRQGAS